MSHWPKETLMLRSFGNISASRAGIPWCYIGGDVTP